MPFADDSSGRDWAKADDDPTERDHRRYLHKGPSCATCSSGIVFICVHPRLKCVR
jgi:hypothetical protein